MKIAKRVFLFVAVNVLVVATISIVLSLLGVRPYLTSRGLDLDLARRLLPRLGLRRRLHLARHLARHGEVGDGRQGRRPDTPDPGQFRSSSRPVHRLAQAAGLPDDARRSGSTTPPRSTPSPPARRRTARSSPSPRASSAAWARARSKGCSATRSPTSPTATW